MRKTSESRTTRRPRHFSRTALGVHIMLLNHWGTIFIILFSQGNVITYQL